MVDSRFSFTVAELALATRMLKDGATFCKIAKALGRRSYVGIRRRLDPAYHKKRNAYAAKTMRKFRERQ